MKLREERELHLVRRIEATLFLVNGDKESARLVLGLDDDEGLIEEFHLDPSTAIGRRALDEQEQRESAAWYAAHDDEVKP